MPHLGYIEIEPRTLQTIVQRLEASFQGAVTLPPAASALEEEVASLKSQLQALRKQVGEIDARTQHLLPPKKK